MTKKLFISIASLSAVAFFAGCQTASQPSTSTSQPSLSNTQISAQYSAADAAALQGALQLKDAAMCDKISDQNSKNDCKNAVSDQKTLADALAKNDASICKQMSLADLQKACEINVETQIKAKQNAADKQVQLQASETLRDKIMASGDYTRCKELKVDGDLNICETNLLVQKAISTKDSSWCNKASVPQNSSSCLVIYKSTVSK